MKDQNRPIIDEQVNIPEHYRIISRTDLRGTILEANSEFIEISGYETDEIIGQPHNILRHPDVPKAVFKDLWDTLQAGKAWTQIVKNRTKDGRYYWEKANAAPIVENGKITGYISIRTPASSTESQAATQAYKDINSGKLIIENGKIYTPFQYKAMKKNPYNRFKIMTKLAMTGMILVTLGFLISAGIAKTSYLTTKDENIKVRYEQIVKDATFISKQTESSALNIAIWLSTNPIITEDVEHDNRVHAKKELELELNTFAKISGKKPKVHIHTVDGKSFLRSWSDKTGDDLTGFRSGVNRIIQTNKAVMGIELGRAGIAIRSISPMFGHDTHAYIGSIEVVTGLDTLVDHFREESIDYVTLLTPSALEIATKAADNPKFGNYTLASTKAFSSDAIAILNQLDIDALKTNGVYKTDTHFLAMTPIKDINDALVGYHIFIEDRARLDALNDLGFNTALNSVLKVTVAMILLIIIFLFLVRKNVIVPIRRMVDAMETATQTGDLSARIDSSTKDEMGQMATAYNNQMQSAQVSLGEAGRMLKDISEGSLSTKTVIPMKGDFLVMKTNLNDGAETIRTTFGEIRGILKEIRAGNFNYSSEFQSHGEFKEAMQDAQAAMTILKKVFFEVNELMSQVAQGFFGRRITAETEGELKELKDNINDSLNQLEAVIQETTQVMIAQGTGDLKKRIEMNVDGTLLVLKEGINNSVTNMSSLLSQSNYSIKQLSDGAIHISQDIADLSDRTQQQAASIEETAASMEEITSTIQQTANNATEANEAANDSLKEAQEANQVVQQTITSINEINEASSKISEITSMIDSIAFQTNLLALNAAVEAARAGEHGRGFAVVAGEVRNLAGKSSEAAKDIRTLIDDTVEKVHEGAKLADESGKALELINESIAKIGTYVSEISQTTAEQAKGVEQVNTAISSIDQATQQNSALVDQTAERTTSMRTMAENVNDVITTFQIDLNQIGFSTAMETGMFTFAHARRAHRQWKGLISAYVEGMDVELNKEAAIDHRKCALGQWFYGPEGQKFAGLPEMQMVEKWHAELHAIIKKILQAHDSGDMESMHDLFTTLDKASEEVIRNLNSAEQAVTKGMNKGIGHNSKLAQLTATTQQATSAKTDKVPTPKPAQKSAQASPAPTAKPKPAPAAPKPAAAAGAGLQTPAPSQPKMDDGDDWGEF